MHQEATRARELVGLFRTDPHRQFLAGQVGADKDGKVGADFDAQCAQTFANIGAALTSQGAGFANNILACSMRRLV